jgi:hypothetical protein
LEEVKAIHLIQKEPKLLPKPIAPGSQIYESGFWSLPIEQAKSLIGRSIYFHEKQLTTSFFGGVIKDCWVQQEGEWKDRVVFRFEASASHKGIRPQNPDGWNWVMNFDEDLVEMNYSEIESRVREAIKILIGRDAKLFSVEASEWALAHRLAVYLEQLIPGWNVDCEYNRQGHGQDSKTDDLGKNIRPDITIHHRGEPAIEDNLLLIEIKKREEKFDPEKVRKCTAPPTANRPFQYRFGLALSFYPEVCGYWFENGQPKPVA